MKIRVQTTSERVWWGIYGFVGKNGWEDLDLYDEQGELIDRIHLYAKDYLRAGLRFLKDDAFQLDYAVSIEKYLDDDQYYFWYYYDKKEDKDRFEVTYDAPRNKAGIKPKAIEIWNPEETIGISTITESVQLFATQFLKQENCTIEINPVKDIDASYESFKGSEENESSPVPINLSPKLIQALSKLWNQPENIVRQKINNLNR